MARIQLKSLRKAFDEVEAVRDVDLDIEHNEFVVLVGPSGCGKSTTLRMIAGLEEVSAGEIWLGDALVNDLPPRDRDIAMVFQSYALYPHMSVFKNMSFGLEMRKMPKDEIAARVKEAAEILDITGLLDRRPRQLSGGERQRVAMGRAIVRKPQAFLFDEPLSNLDAKLRVQMRTEIKLIHSRVETTVVYVTHDQVEAMTLADRIVVMNAGRIEQVGSPQEMYDHPATRFVAGFIGSPAMNFIPCTLEGNAAGVSVRLGKKLSLPVPDERRERLLGLQGQGDGLRHPARAHHRTSGPHRSGPARLRRGGGGAGADRHGHHGVHQAERSRHLRPLRPPRGGRGGQAHGLHHRHGPTCT